MKTLRTLGIICLFLGACQGQSETPETANETPLAGGAETTVNVSVPPDGKITLTAEILQSEEAACVMPLRISNGTEKEVSVAMFGFAVTGSGNDDTGNMFPQDVPAGEYRTARIIQIGQSCAAFDTITLKDVLCKEKGDADKTCDVTFEDSDEIRFVTN